MLSGSHLAGLIHLFLLPEYFLHHCLTHFSASHAAVCSCVYPEWLFGFHAHGYRLIMCRLPGNQLS